MNPEAQLQNKTKLRLLGFFFKPVFKWTSVEPTSLKMGVTKADKHWDLGCRFTESPD